MGAKGEETVDPKIVEKSLTGLKTAKDTLVRVANEVMSEKGVTVDYKFGTMIEIPRAALTADEIAEYTLGFPNNEVKISFLTNIIDEFYHSDIQSGFDYLDFTRDFRSGNVEDVMKRFQALFETLPYANDKNVTLIERDFQNVIYLTFLLLGQFVKVEQHSAKGRADCIVETDEYVYIFVFKRDDTAEHALAQIDEQGYAKPYEADSRKLIKIGAVSSSEERTLTDWKVI